MSDRLVELRRLMVRTAPSESQMLAWLAEFEDRVRAEAAYLDGLTVERLERAMPGYHGVMTQHAIAVALLAALREEETK